MPSAAREHTGFTINWHDRARRSADLLGRRTRQIICQTHH
jgi:hypothetical protein